MSEILENDFPLAIVPEYDILDALVMMLQWIRTDYDLKEDKDTTYIRSLFSGFRTQRYNLVKELEAIVLCGEDDPKALEVNLMFNRHREGAPTIHITLPGENLSHNSMMNGLDYGGYVISGEEDDEAYQTTFTRTFKASYNIMITSANVNECAALYHLTKHMIISLLEYFGLKKFENIAIGGVDLSLYADVVPGLFVKGISMSFDYMTSAPNVEINKFIKSIEYQGKPVNG